MSQENIQSEVKQPMKDTQSRKYQLTINNPIDSVLDHDSIKKILSEFKSLIYYCLADEAGTTHHTHLYLHFTSAVRFSTIKKRFPTAHIELCKGTAQQNMEYISKSGKWINDKKHGTIITGTFEEVGEIPIERQGARNDLADLYDQIKSGMSNFEILEENPDYILQLDKLERIRQTIIGEKYKTTFRELETIYIFGKTGTGKTRSVMEKYGYENVFRVTDYRHPFDRYANESVIIFDEFHSHFTMQQMLNFLDGYPLELPCRYTNKTACFTKVYIISNIDIREQYKIIQDTQPNIWQAFLRRIHHVICFNNDGSTIEYTSAADYLSKSNLNLIRRGENGNPFLTINDIKI